MSNINRTAHAIAMQSELRLRAELQEAVQSLRAARATPEAILDFLTRCAAAGRVLDPLPTHPPRYERKEIAR